MFKKTVTPAAAIAGIIAAAGTGYGTMMGHHGFVQFLPMIIGGIIVGFVVQKLTNKD